MDDLDVVAAFIKSQGIFNEEIKALLEKHRKAINKQILISKHLVKKVEVLEGGKE